MNTKTIYIIHGTGGVATRELVSVVEKEARGERTYCVCSKISDTRGTKHAKLDEGF